MTTCQAEGGCKWVYAGEKVRCSRCGLECSKLPDSFFSKAKQDDTLSLFGDADSRAMGGGND